MADALGIQFVDSSKKDIQSEVPRLLGGRFNALSITGAREVPVDMDYLVTRDIVMVGSLASPNAFPPALRLLASGAVRVGPLITNTFPLDRGVEAFEYVRLRKGPRIKVLVRPD